MWHVFAQIVFLQAARYCWPVVCAHRGSNTVLNTPAVNEACQVSFWRRLTRNVGLRRRRLFKRVRGELMTLVSPPGAVLTATSSPFLS